MWQVLCYWTNTIEFNSHHSPMRSALIHPVYREGKRGQERVRNLPRVTKLVGGRAGMSQRSMYFSVPPSEGTNQLSPSAVTKCDEKMQRFSSLALTWDPQFQREFQTEAGSFLMQLKVACWAARLEPHPLP